MQAVGQDFPKVLYKPRGTLTYRKDAEVSPCMSAKGGGVLIDSCQLHSRNKSEQTYLLSLLSPPAFLIPVLLFFTFRAPLASRGSEVFVL